jgi:hypothetical protein
MKLVGAEIYTSGAVSDEHRLCRRSPKGLPVRWKTHRTYFACHSRRDPGWVFCAAQSDVEYVCLEDTRLANVLNAVLRVFREYALLDDAI